MTVMNRMLASRGRLAICTTARATIRTSIVGSTCTVPFACGTPLAILAVMGVAALPMSIWPQAMSYLRPSRAVVLVRPVIPCLVDVYATEPGRGVCAEIEPLLMIRPPGGCWFFMILNASCVHRKAPVRLMSTTAFHCSYDSSSSDMAGAPMPALLNSTSSRPNVSIVLAKSARTDSGTPTSVWTTSAFDGPAFPSAAAASSRSTRRPARATLYPASRSASAEALPTPVPAPVTIATLFDEAMVMVASCPDADGLGS